MKLFSVLRELIHDGLCPKSRQRSPVALFMNKGRWGIFHGVSQIAGGCSLLFILIFLFPLAEVLERYRLPELPNTDPLLMCTPRSPLFLSVFVLFPQN